MELIRSIDEPQRDDDFVRRIARWLGPLLRRHFRPSVRGLHQIPAGPALYVANHSGGLTTADTYVFADAVIRERGFEDLPYGLGHEIVFQIPVINQLFTRMGVMRASADSARKLFDAGLKALVYPGGDVDVFRPWRDRYRIVFGGRKGYIRLALRNDVPVIPVVSAGTHNTFFVVDDLRWLARLLRADRLLRIKVWPLALSIPWGLTLGPTPPFFPLPVHIVVEALEPIRFERSGQEAADDDEYVAKCAMKVESAMQEALTRLSREL